MSENKAPNHRAVIKTKNGQDIPVRVLTDEDVQQMVDALHAICSSGVTA